ncbi:MAG: hypothetical protein QNJ09_16750, partial [Paracoccaceae bacterium]|nr:hypothetical protein [Paracoccaceae bacterium]
IAEVLIGDSYDWAERKSHVFRAVIAGYDPRLEQFEPPNSLIAPRVVLKKSSCEASRRILRKDRMA